MYSQKWNCAASFPISNDALQFHFWEYLFRIVGRMSLQYLPARILYILQREEIMLCHLSWEGKGEVVGHIQDDSEKEYVSSNTIWFLYGLVREWKTLGTGRTTTP